ncbi:MAG: hexosyltransferase, partial [Chloroflexota bacterium]
SLVMIESWVAGTPVLVHADCAVTVEHCRKANGGLYFRDYEGFAACLDLLLARPDLRQRLGHQGRAYVLAHCTWDVIAETYRRIADSSLRSE